MLTGGDGQLAGTTGLDQAEVLGNAFNWDDTAGITSLDWADLQERILFFSHV